MLEDIKRPIGSSPVPEHAAGLLGGFFSAGYETNHLSIQANEVKTFFFFPSPSRNGVTQNTEEGNRAGLVDRHVLMATLSKMDGWVVMVVVSGSRGADRHEEQARHSAQTDSATSQTFSLTQHRYFPTPAKGSPIKPSTRYSLFFSCWNVL